MNEVELFNKNKLIQQILKMPHGDLKNYVETLPIAKQDIDLFAHFIAWDNKKGKIRDIKAALPIIALRTFSKNDGTYAENALAALLTLSPRDLVKAYRFSKQLTVLGNNITGGWRQALQAGIQKYLEIREENTKWWDAAVVRNRKAMIELYTISHKKPSERAQKILFEKVYPKNSVFEAIKNLKDMEELKAASVILKHKLPMSIVLGAGIKIKDNENLLLSMVENMTGNEILNSTNTLKELGAFNFRSVQASYDLAIEKAKTDTRVNVFKASKAVEKVDKKQADKLITIQRAQAKTLTKINANVLVLADCSGSMNVSLDLGRKIAGVVSSQVTGKLSLVFFNETPRFFDVTGKTYDEINTATKSVVIRGQTSVGCGLQYLLDKKEVIDLIIIISDGGDNYRPLFHDVYKKYAETLLCAPPIYFFRVAGDPDTLSFYCKQQNISIEKFEVDATFDYYALPQILSTIKNSRYDLLNEILDTPLLQLDNSLKQLEEKEIAC